MSKDRVNHPSHYNQGGLEVLDIIEAFDLDFTMGNAAKYILRYKFKDNPIEDLKKAIFYIEHEIKRLEKAEKKKEEIPVFFGETSVCLLKQGQLSMDTIGIPNNDEM